ncbi:ras GEF [Aulographum hederae CBS 113979]|uniref:Ras GEF n=1 Tax=Aulographum hederae CBS 113979 TaxID=1176131 RepID=A0A6G1HDT7_9PEZI|nr:ras GEF [Aulographum hederae CBS 113979]
MPPGTGDSSRRRSSQKAPATDDHDASTNTTREKPRAAHIRNKTKSSQSFLHHQQQHPPRDTSLKHASAGSAPLRSFSGPDLQGRAAYSTQQLPKSQLPGTDEHEDVVDREQLLDDEEIAEDPFFQRYNSPTTTTAAASFSTAAAAAPGQEQHDNGAEDSEPSSDEDSDNDTEGPLSPTSTQARARPDSTAEPLASPRSPIPGNSSGPMHEINIAIIGATGVGKSCFVQRSFDVYNTPFSAVTSRKMSIDGSIYTVRLLEVPFDDLEVEEDNTISWPDTLDDLAMPQIDGVLTLYDVMDKDSLGDVPEILNALNKSSLPFLLVACKCDHHPSHRQVDPAVVEQRAKAFIGDIGAMQAAGNTPDTHKRCVSVVLRAVLAVRHENSMFLAAARRRANSNAVRRVSPRAPQSRHGRASSEFSASLLQKQVTSVYNSDHRPQLSSRSKSAQQLAFVTQDNVVSLDQAAGGEPGPVEIDQAANVDHVSKEKPSIETGYTFDQLVDRLLVQPLSKGDNKFAAIFLALYRKFAAPGQLLDAILKRFDHVDKVKDPQMIKTIAQLRHLAILEQWVSWYPGDFAHPTTRRKILKFVGKVANTRIFSIAAREISADLDMVIEDDDTDWAECDRNREAASPHLEKGAASLSLTDETPDHVEQVSKGFSSLSSLKFGVENQTSLSFLSPTSGRSPSGSTSSSSQTMLNAVEHAQRQARTLTPAPKITLTKIQWHTLIEIPDEVIAKEITRIDWLMFASIRPRDLVRQVSLSNEQKKKCRSLDNVNRMIDHFNHLAYWVTNFILIRDKPKHRALMLEKFMRVARKLRELNNYNALGAMLAGLKSTCIHRLANTRDLIPQPVAKDFMKLEILMGTQKSHFAYRLAWENSSGERIPYIPLHLRDLVSAREGNKTYMCDEDGVEIRGTGERINWRKFEIMGEVIVGVQRAQGVPYEKMGKEEVVRGLLLDVKLVKDDEVGFFLSLYFFPVLDYSPIKSNANDGASQELYERSTHLEAASGGANGKKFAWFQRNFVGND